MGGCAFLKIGLTGRYIFLPPLHHPKRERDELSDVKYQSAGRVFSVGISKWRRLDCQEGNIDYFYFFRVRCIFLLVGREMIPWYLERSLTWGVTFQNGLPSYVLWEEGKGLSLPRIYIWMSPTNRSFLSGGAFLFHLFFVLTYIFLLQFLSTTKHST